MARVAFRFFGITALLVAVIVLGGWQGWLFQPWNLPSYALNPPFQERDGPFSLAKASRAYNTRAKRVRVTWPTSNIYSSKCVPGCWDHGTCNEELGRCDCSSGYTGPDCSRLAMPSCHLSEAYYTPCHLPSSCACTLECQLWGLETGLACFDYKQQGNQQSHIDEMQKQELSEGVGEPSVEFGPLQKRLRTERGVQIEGKGDVVAGQLDVEMVFRSPQVLLVTDGRGLELEPRQPLGNASTIDWAIAPARCPLNCSGHGVCDKTSNTCQCAGLFAGDGCEQPVVGLPFACYSNCSGNGACIDGVCVCTRPFFGADCSLFLPPELSSTAKVLPRRPYLWSDAVPAVLPGEHVRPRLYVYDLPPHMMTWERTQGDALDWQEPLLFFERALNSEYRTVDGDSADFFVLPVVIRKRVPKALFIADVVAYVNTTWPYWKRSSGSDHIFVTNDDWGNCEVDNWGFGEQRFLAAAITLTLWGYRKNMRMEDTHPCFVAGKDIAIPPNMPPTLYPMAPYWASSNTGAGRPSSGTAPGSGGAPGPSPGGRVGPDVQPANLTAGVRGESEERTILLYFKGFPGYPKEGRFQDTGFLKSFGVRQQMFDLYAGRENATSIRVVQLAEGGFLADMARSIFCLAPAGFGWGMRTTQALQMGCIPVIIQPNVTQPFEGELLDWSKFSVKLEMDDIPRLEQILRAFSAEDIERKRAAMRKVWMRFVWTSPSYNPLHLQPELLQTSDVRKLAQGDAFQSVMEILRLRLLLKEKYMGGSP